MFKIKFTQGKCTLNENLQNMSGLKEDYNQIKWT